MSSYDTEVNMSNPARYRLLDSSFDPPEEHTDIGENEYIGPESDLDRLEALDMIEVLEWNYDADTTAPVSFEGPPEPLVSEDGEVTIVHTTDNDTTGLTTVELGMWKCEKCTTIQTLGTNNGEVIEPSVCPEEKGGCGRQGPFDHVGELSKQDAQTALRAANMWNPPATVSDEAYGELWADVRQYIYDHWDAKEEGVYEGLTAYALSTWVRENLTFVPHLMLMGKTTGGKTRLLNTLSRVSYRATVSASATPASLFRMIDAYNVSFFVSEYHGLGPDERRELDNVVRAGQKKGETVTRAEQSPTGFEPKVFDPFSHIAIATQYTPDDDIVNRCIRVRSSPEKRDMPATLDEDRGRDLRNRLLYARYRLLESEEWERGERKAYAYLAERNIAGRTREKLLSLVTVAILWDRLETLEPFVKTVVEQDQDAAADSEDARFVETVRDLVLEEVGSTTVLGDADPFTGIEIPYSEIVKRYETMNGVEKSASWVGHICSRLSFETERKRDGTVIQDTNLRPKLQELCEEHNLPWESSGVHDPIEELPDSEQYQMDCSECGERRSTHRHVTEGHYVCEQCAEELREVQS